ncbi:hypothetical protein AYO20_02445 [Fonsecaea nubica]|uniref:Protein kinase domain-containing protein n=1 Tax=Fonsecaea nubica TaxID=856822 RepID=A0A178D9G1_9EURO|nr:hypothetical protein AYO20_02445 [Fonsecaea nubica]OAL38386.1 hypothetical protein AYO20_02445 [Fonsecaea nubica]
MSLISAADFNLRTLQTVLNYEELVKTFFEKRATFEAALQRAEQELYPKPSFPTHKYYTNEISTGSILARKNFLAGGATALEREEEIKKEFRIMEKLTHVHITTVMFWLRSDTVYSIFMKPACDMNLRYCLEHCISQGYPQVVLM